METIIRHLSNEAYHHGEPYRDFLSSTQLKDYLVSPKYAHDKAVNPERYAVESRALQLGSLYHEVLADFVETGSTEQWRDKVAVFNAPTNPKTGAAYGATTNAYQTAYSAFLAENEGKTVVSENDIALVSDMVGELLNRCGDTTRLIRRLCEQGEAEVSHFVEDYKGSGFKFRPDLETNGKIIDWKTVSLDDLSEKSITSQITKYGYHISAAFYQFFEHEQSGNWKDFYWVFQQKVPPYDAVMVSAAEWAYSKVKGVVVPGEGAILFERLLQQHIYCKEHQEWQGAEVFIVPKGKAKYRIMVPEVPKYYQTINFHNN